MSVPLPLFVESPECKSRKHCAACRDTMEEGRRWRERQSRRWQMPNDCPHGRPWGVQPLTVARIAHGAAGIAKAVAGTGGATAELIEQRTAICESCDEAETVGGTFRRCRICKCGTWPKVRNASESCPIGKWGPATP